MPLDDQSELFVWVDEKDQELGWLTRQEAHSGSRKIHRAVTIIILNQDRTKILFQKRSLTKDLSPGIWGCGVGGHVTFGDTYEQAAERELREELGIMGAKIHFLMKHLYRMPSEQEFMPVYETLIPEDTNLTLDPSEVAEVYWCPTNNVSGFVTRHPMTPDTVEMLIQTGYLTDYLGAH